MMKRNYNSDLTADKRMKDKAVRRFKYMNYISVEYLDNRSRHFNYPDLEPAPYGYQLSEPYPLDEEENV